MKTKSSFHVEFERATPHFRHIATGRAWLAAIAAGALAFSAEPSFAATYTYTGNSPVDGAWNRGPNWVDSSGNAIVGSTITQFTSADTIVFRAADAARSSASILGDLRVGTWRFSNVSSGFDITGAQGNNNQVGIISSALIVDEDSGSITIRGTIALDGSVTFTNNSGSDLAPNPVIFTQNLVGGSEGFSFLNGATTVSGAPGSLTLAKGAFQFQGVAKDYAGEIKVQNGATFISNQANFTSNKFQVTVESGGRLTGAGTLGSNGGTAAVLIKSGGSLLIGDSINSLTGTLSFGKDLTLESGSLSLLKLQSGTSYDQVSVGGLLTYGGELRLTIASDLLESLTGGETFNLFTGGFAAGGALDSITVYDPGATSIADIGKIGELNSLGDGIWSGEIEGVEFSFNEASGTLQAVPEPGETGLLLAGGAFLMARVFWKRAAGAHRKSA